MNMKKTKIVRFALLLVIALAIVGILYYLLTRIGFYSRSSVSVLVTPVDAKVEIDGNEYKNGEYVLDKGKKHVKISKAGYQTKEYDIEMKSWHSAMVHDYLMPDDGNFSNYLANEDSFELLKLADIDDNTVKDFIKKAEQKYTIADILPLSENRKTEFHGVEKDQYLRIFVEKGNADCFEFFCLKLESNLQPEDFAREVLAGYGYNLDDYSFVSVVLDY